VYVYRHRKVTDNEVFYIGISKGRKRPASSHHRSSFWGNIVKKHGFYSEIIATPKSWEDACELETLLILSYGRRDLKTGILVNLTDGGEGSPNTVRTPETIEKFIKSMTGSKRSDETKLKMRKANAKNIKVIDTVTGIIYISISEAARDLNLKSKNVSRYLNGSSKKNPTTLKFLN